MKKKGIILLVVGLGIVANQKKEKVDTYGWVDNDWGKKFNCDEKGR